MRSAIFARADLAVARRVVTDGHDIGNHTQDHRELINAVIAGLQQSGYSIIPLSQRLL